MKVRLAVAVSAVVEPVVAAASVIWCVVLPTPDVSALSTGRSFVPRIAKVTGCVEVAPSASLTVTA
ncbi:hypothetical protein AFCDBAGC_2649 [Methylobacterium cerastii]|uniref:Secreted protein n=1 Tax=Methylobacterium cerastii TaxID=932741 RepID=A0ABQ4QIY1_9HYPH|nr:hypothetical protein AFCDBAGC_2649 [Methylobacterium cerastii]